MVQLPDVRQIQRNQPQYTGQVMNVPVGQDAQGMADIAGSVGRLANVGADYAIQQERLDAKRLQAEQDAIQARQDEIDKFQVFSAKANASNSMKMLTATLEKDPEYNKTPEKFDAGFKNIREQTIASLPEHIRNDPLRMSYIETSLQNKYTDNRLKLLDAQYKQQEDAVKASLFETSNQFVQNYAMLDPTELNEAKSTFNAQIKSAIGAGIITQEQGVKMLYETITNAERNRLSSLPPEQVVQELSGIGVTDFDQSVNHVLKTEGGYNPSDGRSNAPVIFGMNKKYNPDLYEKIKTLYDGGKTEEAKNIAKQGYKKRYWDTINADSLPANLRLMAFDTAVNQGVDVAKDLINQSGGDVAKFAELRIARYEKLNQPENIKGWKNRTNEILNLSRNSNVRSNLPQGELVDFLNKNNKILTEKQQKQRIDDIINTVNTQYPDNYEAKVAIVGGLNISFDERKKIMTILDADKKRQDVIKRDDAEQLSLKAIEWINQGGLFENMPADLSIKLNASQRTFLQQHSDKVNNKEGMKAEQEQLLKQAELLEYTKVREIISSGDINKLKTEYPPEKAVALLSPKHYEQYLNAISLKDDAMPKATQQEENRRINAMFVNIGIHDKKNKNNLIDQGLFYDRYYDEREAFISENGRQPKGSEVQSIIDNLTKERVIEKTGSSWKSYLFSGGSEMEFKLPKQEEKKQIKFIRFKDANS